MGELLNDSQKNSLQIVLQMFEENLRDAQSWLDGHEEDAILYRRKLTLSEGNRNRVAQEIKAALSIIEQLTRTFGLESRPESVGSMLRGEFAINWANLIDSQAGKLRRYGKVPPELAGILDSDIQNLAEIAFNLSTILGQSKQEKP